MAQEGKRKGTTCPEYLQGAGTWQAMLDLCDLLPRLPAPWGWFGASHFTQGEGSHLKAEEEASEAPWPVVL